MSWGIVLLPEMLPAAGALNSYSYTGTGGMTVGGTATLAKEKAYAASGGMTVAGAAALAKGKAYLAAGGLTISGSAVTTGPSGVAIVVYQWLLRRRRGR